MATYKVHVFIVACEIVLDVEAETEREALDKAHMLADDALLAEFHDPSTKTVAITYEQP